MKKHFLTGLVLLLPLAITLFIFNLLISFLTAPFFHLGEYFLDQIEHITIYYPSFFKWLTKVTLFLLLSLVIIFFGILGKVSYTKKVFEWHDKIFLKIPIANKIYQAVQDVMRNLFQTKKPSFSKVVLVPFPSPQARAIGFITRDDLPTKDYNQKSLVSVFLPGTPNPTMGFMLMFKQEEIIQTDLTLEEAIKFVVSCGVIYNHCKKN